MNEKVSPEDISPNKEGFVVILKDNVTSKEVNNLMENILKISIVKQIEGRLILKK